MLGRALAAVPGRREKVVIASKFGKHSGEEQVRYGDAEIRAALSESLRCLQTTWIDYYQVHWPGNVNDVDEVCETLEALKAEGAIKAYGFCNFGAGDMEVWRKAVGKAQLMQKPPAACEGGPKCDAAAPGTAKLHANQLPYNLLWRAVEDGVVPFMQEAGCGLLAYSPLQQGLLSGKFESSHQVPEGRRRTRHFKGDSTSMSRHGQDGCEDQLWAAVASLRTVCGEPGCGGSAVDMAAGAVAWLLAQPTVVSVIVGASSPDQVRRNAALVDLTPEQLAEMTAVTEALRITLGPNPDMWAKVSRVDTLGLAK